MKNRLDNRGFTLVEIIIAVAILALVISPLVANFIQSSKLNLESRKSLNEMNLAQDVMEGISGYAVKDVVGIVDGVIADSSKSLAGSVLPSAATYGSVSKTSSPTDATVVYKMTNVETAGTAHNKYDVVMTFDPTNSAEEKFNNQEMATISEINQYYDAIYNYPTSEVETAVKELKKKSPLTNTFPIENYYGEIERTIKVSILNEGTESAPIYKVRVDRIYKPNLDLMNNASLPADAAYTATTDNISRMDADQLPRSVYIYYEGIQKSTYTEPLDNIEIINRTGEEITVYLVRNQKVDALTGAADAETITYGTTYGCNVRITSEDMTGVRTEDVHIVSNLRYDLNAPSPKYNFRTTEEDGVTPLDSTKFPMKDATNRLQASDSKYQRIRANYYYNGTLINEALYQSNFSAGYARETKNTLYKVTIDIYNPTSGEKVATYDGGMAN
ncbi:MAG: prepilin-type N-terminal cleavage/methylation domain-containing protein [Lachnospiraceae bacterium]|nr:prepilin-type N-terminal cleavage/methylation domain-containing protein [Lachnospiraceae bacterium]